AAGWPVIASDLLPRADGIVRHDFLRDPAPAEAHGAAIVTNPPFNALDRFMRRGLVLLDCGDASALVLLLRNDALTAGSRAWALNRASAQFACCWRPIWLPGTRGGGRWSNAWMMWRADRAGPPVTRYLRRADIESTAPLFGDAA